MLLAALPPGFLFADDVVTVAVASNFWKTATEISAAFTEESGVSVRISAGSTGKLYAQIINGAPFDVLLAADQERPSLLETNGHAVNGSRFTYARGVLCLWSPLPDRVNARDGAATLRAGDFNRLAMANPALAPYGQAALDTLRQLQLEETEVIVRPSRVPVWM